MWTEFAGAGDQRIGLAFRFQLILRGCIQASTVSEI
jgi:hypothetical protein